MAGPNLQHQLNQNQKTVRHQQEREEGRDHHQDQARNRRTTDADLLKDQNGEEAHQICKHVFWKKGAIENKQVFCPNKSSNVLQMYMF
jgi:hypothetical protein